MQTGLRICIEIFAFETAQTRNPYRRGRNDNDTNKRAQNKEGIVLYQTTRIKQL